MNNNNNITRYSVWQNKRSGKNWVVQTVHSYFDNYRLVQEDNRQTKWVNSDDLLNKYQKV